MQGGGRNGGQAEPGVDRPGDLHLPGYQPGGRGLHSFTSQLNLSAFYGIGEERRGCVARVKGVFRGV